MSNKKEDKILEIILKHVSNEGWKEEILDSVNKDIKENLAGKDTIIFTSIKDLVSEYLKRNDDLMLLNLEKVDISKLKIRQRIRKAIITKFLQTPREVLNHTAKFLSNPLNADIALKSLSNSCDKIWYWAGDESTDFNYYTKRVLLGGVYTVSLAYYLKEEDCSIDDLSIFVENRIDNILQLGGLKEKITGAADFILKNIKK